MLFYKKGQSSVELLVVLGVILIIILGFTILAQEGLIQAQSQRDMGVAEITVNEVADAAETVCRQGMGAKKKIFIEIPGSVNLNESYIGKPSGSMIESKTINLNLRGTDIFRTLSCEVRGNWMDRTGKGWITIESRGTYVRIGECMVILDYDSLYFLMSRDSSASKTISFTSVYDENIDIDVEETWDHTGISLSISPDNFMLTPEGERNVEFSVTAGGVPTGIYSGYFIVDVSSGDFNEEITIPITVEIRSSGGSGEDECECFDWRNVECGADTCSENQMQQSRLCSPRECAIENRCVNDMCSGWLDVGCGSGSCDTGQLRQIRSCLYGCEEQERCLDDDCVLNLGASGCGGGADPCNPWETVTAYDCDYDCLSYVCGECHDTCCNTYCIAMAEGHMDPEEWITAIIVGGKCVEGECYCLPG